MSRVPDINRDAVAVTARSQEIFQPSCTTYPLSSGTAARWSWLSGNGIGFLGFRTAKTAPRHFSQTRPFTWPTIVRAVYCCCDRAGQDYKCIEGTRHASYWTFPLGRWLSGNALPPWSHPVSPRRAYFAKDLPYYDRLGRKADAAEVFSRGLEADPERRDIATSLALAYSDLEKWSDVALVAGPAVENWSANEPGKGAMFYLMGKVYEKRDGDYESAIRMFEQARSDPAWGSFAVREIDRQQQLIAIRDAREG